MAVKEIVFKREELYERIWAIPIVRLSKEFGISDVALAKICKKLKVPRPPRGYWAKLEFNKKVRRPPLPDISPGIPREHVHHDYPKPEYETAVNREIRQSISIKRDIIVPANLDNPHRLVITAKSILERTKSSEKGLLNEPRSVCLDMKVSPACLERALRIMDAIIWGFEAESFSVAVERGLKASTYVTINEEKVFFSITEDSRCVDHIPTLEEAKKKARFPWEIKKYDYHPTGELSLKIENTGAYGNRKRWSDSKTGKLEEKIGQFISGAILVACALKTERQNREENKRKWEEERRQKEENEKRLAEEKARLQELEQQAALWAKSEQIRGFVQAVETEVAGRDFPEEQKQRIGAWMAWARMQADRMDPIKLSFPK